jgi:hypothetical protein
MTVSVPMAVAFAVLGVVGAVLVMSGVVHDVLPRFRQAGRGLFRPHTSNLYP